MEQRVVRNLDSVISFFFTFLEKEDLSVDGVMRDGEGDVEDESKE